MKKIISLFTICIFTFSFSQKSTIEIEKKLNKLWNPNIANLIYGEDEKNTKPKIKKEVIKFYTCMVKNYNFNPKWSSEFMTEKELQKEIEKNQEFKKELMHTYAEFLSFHWNSYARLNYEHRIGNQKEYPKCIKKSDIDY